MYTHSDGEISYRKCLFTLLLTSLTLLKASKLILARYTEAALNSNFHTLAVDIRKVSVQLQQLSEYAIAKGFGFLPVWLIGIVFESYQPIMYNYIPT